MSSACQCPKLGPTDYRLQTNFFFFFFAFEPGFCYVAQAIPRLLIILSQAFRILSAEITGLYLHTQLSIL